MRSGRIETGLTLGLVLFALAWASFLVQIHITGRASVLDRVEDIALDWRFALTGPRPAPGNVVIVAIDDATIAAYRQYPLSRSRLAALVRALTFAKAASTAFDLLLIDPETPAADGALASALRGTPTAVATAATFAQERPGSQAGSADQPGMPVADAVLWPLELFRNAASIGTANVSAAPGGTPRHLPLIVRAGDQILPSLPLRAATLARGTDAEIGVDRVRIGPTQSRVDLGMNLPLRFYGPRGSIRTVSFLDALEPGNAPLFAGKSVIVGVTGLGTGDTFATPYDSVLPGVEVLATGLLHLTNGDGLVRTPAIRLFDAVCTLLIAVSVIPLILWRRTFAGLGLASCLLAASAVLALIAFANGFWLSMALPLAATLPPALLAFAARLLLIQITERRLRAERQRLRQFQPAALADRLSRSGDYLAVPVQQKLAILFIDLSGFTTTSEQIGLGETRTLLKGLHDVIDREVSRASGIVLSYMGDGAMIVFGLPDPDPSDAARAVSAAVVLSADVTAWLGTLEGAVVPTGVRIGGHFGDALVSRLGGDAHQHITATGDSVNVTSRLLQVASDHRTAIVFSLALLDAAGPAAVAAVENKLSPERQIPIRGRQSDLGVKFWNPC